MRIQPNLKHEHQTRATRVRHECDMSATQTIPVRHECYMSDTNATRVKNFDFDNETSENIFSHPYIYYMASERLQVEEQFHFKNYLLVMCHFHAKMRLKSAPQKMNFSMAKDISKSYTLDCSCTLMPLHVPAQLRIVTQPQGKVRLNSFRNFAYVSNCLHLNGFAWKRDCPISSKLQTSRIFL